MKPSAIKHIVMDGHSLTLESFVAVARYGATVELADSALEAMKKSRALADKIASEGRVAYGITTGFGEFQKVAVPKEMSNQLSTNLILSHCTAAGDPCAPEISVMMLSGSGMQRLYEIDLDYGMDEESFLNYVTRRFQMLTMEDGDASGRSQRFPPEHRHQGQAVRHRRLPR